MAELLLDRSLPVVAAGVALGLVLAYGASPVRRRFRRARLHRTTFALAIAMVEALARHDARPDAITIPGAFVDQYGEEGLCLLTGVLAAFHLGNGGRVADVLDADPLVVELYYVALAINGGETRGGTPWMDVWDQMTLDQRHDAILTFAYATSRLRRAAIEGV